MIDELSSAVGYLEKALTIIINRGWTPKDIGPKYAELLVANKLKKFRPKIGDERKSDEKSSDIYLAKINKKIEVKWSNLHFWKGCKKHGNIEAWDCRFGDEQIKKRKFDFFVMVTSHKNRKPKFYIFTFEELKSLKKVDVKAGKGYDIALYCKPKFELIMNCKDCVEKMKVERDLNLHPKKYESRWDKIK
jgi:hypothetical protein